MGRFAQPDSIIPNLYNPQSLNRYVYVLNNPVKYTDPTGHCPWPAARMGAAICVALFIKPAVIPAGPFTLHGDNRDFSSDSPADASRGYTWIPISNPAEHVDHYNQTGYENTFTTDPETGDIVPYYGTSWAEPSSINRFDVTFEENGMIEVNYDLVLGGPLGNIAPHINGSVRFSPGEKGGYNAYGARDGFPWAEAYYWDAEGNVSRIFQSPAVRGDPYDLRWNEDQNEKNLLYLGAQFTDYLFHGFQSPQPAIIMPD